METQNKSKILELLYGKIFTYDERITYGEEVNTLVYKAGDIEQEFSDKIKGVPELSELFEKLIESEEILKNAELDTYFTEGFKTGLLIGIEAGEWVADKIKK